MWTHTKQGEEKEIVRHPRTFISSKYFALLCSGTILAVQIGFITGAADTLIAGIVLGETAVAGICLAQPVYSMASFFAVSLFISFLHFFRSGNTLRLNLAFSPGILRDILKYGIVDASMHLSLSLFTAALNFFVLKRFGSDMLILVSVITLIKEAQILFEGIGEAITPLISTYYGEECYPGILNVWKLALSSVRTESVLSTVILLVFAPSIVGLIGIENAATQEYAVWGLRILSLTLYFSCRLFLDSSYFILVDKVPLGVFDSVLRDLFPALPLAVLGGLIGDVYGMYIGLMTAPALGYILSVLYIKRKYGRENYPLLLEGMRQRKRIKLFEFCVSPEANADVRDRIGITMKESGCPERLINRTMFIFEELFMLIYDHNPAKTVRAECAVEPGGTVRLTTKDDGRVVDLTDTDNRVVSLRSYALSNMIGSHTTRRGHSLALSYNHNVLEISPEGADERPELTAKSTKPVGELQNRHPEDNR